MITKDVVRLVALIKKHRGIFDPLSEADIKWILANPEAAFQHWVKAVRDTREDNLLLPWRKNIGAQQMCFVDLLREAKQKCYLGNDAEQVLIASEPLEQPWLFDETPYHLTRIEVRTLGLTDGVKQKDLMDPDFLPYWSERNLRTQRVTLCTPGDVFKACRSYRIGDGSSWAAMRPVQDRILWIASDNGRATINTLEVDPETLLGPSRHILLRLQDIPQN